MIKRKLALELENRLFSGKILLLLGPRQTGKTTLIRTIIVGSGHGVAFVDGDDATARETFGAANTADLRRIIGGNKILFVDEAQRIPNIGLALKIVADQMKDVQVISSGSSALDLGNALNEPLTGRKRTFHLFPVTWQEWVSHQGYLPALQSLESRVLYGMYPEVLLDNRPEEVLKELASSYLYRDVLALSGIRKPAVLEKLVQALAFQLGHEVSYNELAQTVQVDKNTIMSYIDLLEKAFVVFTIPPFSSNMRNEISSTRKVYFYDNGIRNAVLSDYKALDLRQDKGALWENFIISERMKYHEAQGANTRMYFWRNRSGQEIDLVEQAGGTLQAFEIKWKEKKSLRTPRSFAEAYGVEMHQLHSGNFNDYLLDEV